MKTVDAHQHFWNPHRGDFGWLPQGDIVLDRSYTPANLESELKEAGVDATVLVQAALSLEETEYLLGIADVTPFVAGVVGWIDLENRTHLAPASQRRDRAASS